MRRWDYTPVPLPDGSAPKACVNWGAIDGWAQDHNVNIRDPGMVVYPKFRELLSRLRPTLHHKRSPTDLEFFDIQERVLTNSEVIIPVRLEKSR